jgi:hypothetical protein
MVIFVTCLRATYKINEKIFMKKTICFPIRKTMHNNWLLSNVMFLYFTSLFLQHKKVSLLHKKNKCAGERSIKIISKNFLKKNLEENP